MSWKFGIQPLSAEVGSEFLELAESRGSLLRLQVGADFVVAAGALDEGIGAPEVAVAVDHVRLAIDPGDDRQSASAGFRMVLVEQALQGVGRDAGDVFHQGGRILEDVMVDPLVDVADPHPRLVVPGTVGVVDVPGAVGLGINEIGPHVEEGGDVSDVVHAAD